ncbi:MAG: hypothetical protein KIS88_00815 [Anaerolineales bacterium]|nr:hypothetical protein [Anaerolineales bacterium]
MERHLDVFAPRTSPRWAAEQTFTRQLLWARLARCLQPTAAQATLPAASMRRYLGTQDMPMSALRPHPRRAGAYDGQLRPLQPSLRHRWVVLCLSGQAALAAPIQVLKIDGAYYLEDGHARASVASAQGRLYLRAQVWEHTPTPAQTTLQPRVTLDLRLVEQL